MAQKQTLYPWYKSRNPVALHPAQIAHAHAHAHESINLEVAFIVAPRQCVNLVRKEQKRKGREGKRTKKKGA
jgi:hypothetical protein